MKNNSKQHLKNVFGSLISNDRCIDGAKNSPWWIAIIMFVIGVFLPVVPLMVQSGKTYGSSFLSANTYGFENSITGATKDMLADDVEFTVEGNHKLVAYKGETAIVPETREFEYTTNVKNGRKVESKTNTITLEKPVYQYKNSQTNQYDLEIYWAPSKSRFDVVNEMSNALCQQKYQVGTTNDTIVEDDPNTEENEAAGVKYYAPSFVIFFPDGIFSALIKANTNEVATSSYNGNDWEHFEEGYKVLANMIEVEGVEKDMTNKVFTTGVQTNWEKLFDKTYLNQKKQNFWDSTGIYTGVFALITLFMGLMIWLLTRGKKNMFNYLKLHTCLMIEAYACLAPGLLGLILGFLMKNYAMMIFIILIGLRTMWMSMKQLRPQY